MFVSQIDGPASEYDFAERCADIVLPGLSEREITAAPWTTDDGSAFYLHGFHDGDPCSTVSEIVRRAGWDARTLVLRTLHNPLGLPGGRTTDCVMPHNKHAIQPGETFKRCTNRHVITDNHAVVNCPVCSLALR